MERDDNSSLFEGIPPPADRERGVADELPGGRTVLQDSCRLTAMPKEDLIHYVKELHGRCRSMEEITNFLSWESRDYQDSAAYFSRAASLAHKLNAASFDNIADIAVQDVPQHFRCGSAALFLYNQERARFELCRSSAPADDRDIQAWGNDLPRRLFGGCGYPFVAEYFRDRGVIELDYGRETIEYAPRTWAKIFGARALAFPLAFPQTDSSEPLMLGGLVIGDARNGFGTREVEASIIYADLLSGSLHTARLLRKLNALTMIDPLTQIYNRRHLINQLGDAMIQANRQGHPLSIVMLDIDHFKRFNDQYGHTRGDGALQMVASVLKAGIRSGGDLAARYGGEEFMLVMPFAGLDTAVGVANRIRRAINSRIVRFGDSELSVTCSFGVAEYAQGESLEGFIDRADAMLYRAKEEGRNRVCAGTDHCGKA